MLLGSWELELPKISTRNTDKWEDMKNSVLITKEQITAQSTSVNFFYHEKDMDQIKENCYTLTSKGIPWNCPAPSGGVQL
jgi:hypothetical protein